MVRPRHWQALRKKQSIPRLELKLLIHGWQFRITIHDKCFPWRGWWQICLHGLHSKNIFLQLDEENEVKETAIMPNGLFMSE